MTNKIILLIFCCSLLGVTSCKNYLREDLVSGVSYDYYNTEEGMESAVNSVYSELRTPIGTEQVFSLSEYGTDAYTEAEDGSNRQFNQYSTLLNASAGFLRDIWNSYYRGINGANLCIDLIPKVRGTRIYATEAGKNKRIGEMRFLRAYYYFMLVQTFGKVPLVTKGNLEVKTDFKRSSVADIYRQIISDLRYAGSVLETSYATEGGRATQGAAMHLLSKVYLTRASAVTDQRGQQTTDLDSAAYYAEQVIGSKVFTLETDYGTIFKPGNERNKEVIFAVMFSKTPINNGNGNQNHLFFLAVYEKIGGMVRDLANGRAYRRLRPTDYLLDVYNRKIDSRFYKSYKMTYFCNSTSNVPKWDAASAPRPDLAGKPKFGLGDTAGYVTLNKGLTQAEINKRPYSFYPRELHTDAIYPTLNKYIDPGRADLSATQGVRDFVVMRFGETYLLAAEAYARKGQYQKAADLVNVIRKRAAWKEGEVKTKEFYTVEGGSTADITKSTETEMQVAAADISANVVDFFLDERAREMNGEMWRWFDLVRSERLVDRVKKYNRLASNIRDFHKLRPIPQTHIDLLSNPGPLSEEQNEGYY